MVYTLLIHQDAKADLETLWKSEPKAAARIAVALEELKGNQDLLDALLAHGFGGRGDELIEVKKWVEFWKAGADIWRFKLWDLERLGLAYRVIYSYEPKTRRYYVLGIFPRSFAYDPNDERTKRVKNAYDQL